MPTPTYTALANITLGSSASSVTFSSIPATYRDLVLVATGLTSAYGEMTVRFNGDSGSNYSHVLVYGYGGGTLGSEASASRTTGFIGLNNTTGNLTIAQVMDYSATDKHKTWLSRNTFTDGNTLAFAGRWANTSAITSILVSRGAATFSAGQTISLYGIAS